MLLFNIILFSDCVLLHAHSEMCGIIVAFNFSLSPSSMQMGRKTVLVYSAAINIFLAGGVAALAHIFSGSSTVVTYVIVVLICVYAFSFSYSWL